MAEVRQAAKKAFEKVAKKKPDPAGLALAEEAQAALTGKDFATAKEKFQRAQALCEASDAKPAARPKPAKPAGDAGGAGQAKDAKAAKPEEAVDKEVLLPQPGSEGHRVAKDKANLGDLPNFAVNSDAKLMEHLRSTGSKWRTRFPPEPNGYLHIGHAKAMHFDFGIAKKHGGETYLRFDDTNPAAEKQEYIDSILSSVKWLGHEPAKVTYSSDYFDTLHELAVELIKRGKAYVCHQTKEETAASRQLLQGFQLTCAREGLRKSETPLPEGAASPFRERSVETNLSLFEKMTAGECAEGECSLRMKGDLRSDITSMWDLAAYRVKFATHPHSGDKYCVYPTYDYTHCLVDSLENVTHSLCTLEFETRQAPNGPYYWLLDALDMYKPVTWELRCNITYNVMSKRKLNKLTDGHVAGWTTRGCSRWRPRRREHAELGECVPRGARGDEERQRAAPLALGEVHPGRARTRRIACLASRPAPDRDREPPGNACRWSAPCTPRTPPEARGSSTSRARCSSSGRISARWTTRTTTGSPPTSPCAALWLQHHVRRYE